MANIDILQLVRIATTITALVFQFRIYQCVNGTKAQYLAASWHITFSGLTLVLVTLSMPPYLQENDYSNVAIGCLGAMIWTYLATRSYVMYDNWYKDSFTKLKKGFKRLQEQWLPRPAVA